jgi:hypothetical protein
MGDWIRIRAAIMLGGLGVRIEKFGQWLIDLSERIDLPFPPIIIDEIHLFEEKK